jgi:hypothetical protein
MLNKKLIYYICSVGFVSQYNVLLIRNMQQGVSPKSAQLSVSKASEEKKFDIYRAGEG